MPPDELTLPVALEMLDKAGQAEQPLGTCPETGRNRCSSRSAASARTSQRGTADDEEKPQNASLLRGMEPEHVDLQTALKLLSLPRTLGRPSAER